MVETILLLLTGIVVFLGIITFITPPSVSTPTEYADEFKIRESINEPFNKEA